MMSIVDLPENILLNILKLCNAQDLAKLSGTCSLLYWLMKDPLLWRHLCFRDFKVFPGSCEISSCEEIYKNLLHQYGCLLGLYQSQIPPYGTLLEIRFQAGIIEGVVWEPTSDVMEPLQESIAFSIKGNEVPAKCLCLPDKLPHECSLHGDKRKGTVTQHCSDTKKHINALCDVDQECRLNPEDYPMKLVFLNDVITTGLIHKPLRLPGLHDIPSALRRTDGSFPQQIITPGLFKGTYGAQGIELLLFRYKDEHEIHGHKVTGDCNVPAGKVSVKINLKYPVCPAREGNSLAALKSIEPKSSDTPLDQIPGQPFSLPRGCIPDTDAHIPTKCTARYHGFGQIAYDGFQRPTFSPVHVVVFNDDLLGVIWIELDSFSLYSRVKKTFTTNNMKMGPSCL